MDFLWERKKMEFVKYLTHRRHSANSNNNNCHFKKYFLFKLKLAHFINNPTISFKKYLLSTDHRPNTLLCTQNLPTRKIKSLSSRNWHSTGDLYITCHPHNKRCFLHLALTPLKLGGKDQGHWIRSIERMVCKFPKRLLCQHNVLLKKRVQYCTTGIYWEQNLNFVNSLIWIHQ